MQYFASFEGCVVPSLRAHQVSRSKFILKFGYATPGPNTLTQYGNFHRFQTLCSASVQGSLAIAGKAIRASG